MIWIPGYHVEGVVDLVVGLRKDGKNKIFQHNAVIIGIKTAVNNEMFTLWTFIELTLTNIREILSIIMLLFSSQESQNYSIFPLSCHNCTWTWCKKLNDIVATRTGQNS